MIHTYDGIEGVITIKDVLSEFVGDLPDEHDERFSGIRRLGPGQWVVEGKTDIDDFEEFFGLDPQESDVATVGGLYLSYSEKLPNINEKITIHGLELTGEEGIYEGYMIVGSIGAFIEKLGMEDISSNLDNAVGIVNFDINSTAIEEIKFIKPSLAERFYISISNPLFTYMFFGSVTY